MTGAVHLFEVWDEVAPGLAAAGPLVACFDFDGTLVGIRARPEDVVAGEAVREALGRLADAPETVVAVVSGRPAASLRAQVPAARLWLVGHHGLTTAAPGEADRATLDVAEARRRLEPIRRRLAEIVAAHPGTRLEDKGASLALHTRGADRPVARDAAEAFAEAAGEAAGFELLSGKEIHELRPEGVDKGRAVRALVARVAPEGRVLYAGDDTTDEDVFAALEGRPDAVTIRVGEAGDTRARFRLDGPGEILELLGRLAALRRG